MNWPEEKKENVLGPRNSISTDTKVGMSLAYKSNESDNSRGCLFVKARRVNYMIYMASSNANIPYLYGSFQCLHSV